MRQASDVNRRVFSTSGLSSARKAPLYYRDRKRVGVILSLGVCGRLASAPLIASCTIADNLAGAIYH